MEKIPCIKCTSEMWKYIKPYLKNWEYKLRVTSNWINYPLLIINECGILGVCNNYDSNTYFEDAYNRELITDVEEFLERAAALKGFTYKRKDVMKINGIEIKPGMVITTEDNIDYIAFPTREGIAFANNTYGGWTSRVPENIVRINDLTIGEYIDAGATLWEKPKEVVITMDEIAKKFGYPVEQIKIRK